ncbi:MAG: methyltransferase domain-containing protein [Chloroflexi bacterium]|nr:methyltransferase domain-containing protein [Chloroflexota bacterium]
MTAQPEQGQHDAGAWSTREAVETWRRGTASRADALGPVTERMLDLAGVAAGGRVLDVAAGTGDQTLLAARRVGPTGSILATDLSPTMLEAAADAAREAGFTNVETRVMDAQDLQVDPDSFDAAISRFGLMLMPLPQQALAGIRRALEPGGKLAAIVFSGADKNPHQALPVLIARRHRGLPAQTPGEAGMFALGGDGVLEDALRAAGFREVAVHPFTITRRAASAVEAVTRLKDSLLIVRELLAPLDAAEREAVWAEIERELRRFEGPDGFAVSGEALIGVGTK